MRDSDKKDLEMINLYKKELYPAGKAADRQEPFTWKDAAHAVAPALLYTALANVVYSLFFQALAGRHQSLHLLGRLAEYKYYNMDAIVAQSLALCDRLLFAT